MIQDLPGEIMNSLEILAEQLEIFLDKEICGKKIADHIDQVEIERIFNLLTVAKVDQIYNERKLIELKNIIHEAKNSI